MEETFLSNGQNNQMGGTLYRLPYKVNFTFIWRNFYSFKVETLQKNGGNFAVTCANFYNHKEET